jgi:hypothetical protein
MGVCIFSICNHGSFVYYIGLDIHVLQIQFSCYNLFTLCTTAGILFSCILLNIYYIMPRLFL